MSSYEKKAINFVTNGPITVRDLSELGLIPDGQTVFPLHFYEMGWGTWLPMSCTLLLPYFSDGIAKGLNIERLISYLNEKVKPDTFILNDKGIPSENELLVDREVKVKRRLELNGFFIHGMLRKLYSFIWNWVLQKNAMRTQMRIYITT